MRSTEWHREDIKAELRKRFGSVVKLSAEWGYARSAISHVLTTPCFSMPLERRIAAALGVPLHTLWPDRWTPEGAPLPRSGKGSSAALVSPHRQRGKAA